MVNVHFNGDKKLIISNTLTKNSDNKLESVGAVFSVELFELWKEIENE